MHLNSGRSIVGRWTLAIAAGVLLVTPAAHVSGLRHDFLGANLLGSGSGQTAPVDVDGSGALPRPSPLEFIDTSFENASPLWWELEDDHTIRIRLVYDHERDSPNRANGHWHFRLETWIEAMIEAGEGPELAFDLHNDQSGRIHVSRPSLDLGAYLEQVGRYEALMREHTWFTEGRTGGSFRNPGSIGEGLLGRFGIVAFVQELNANWIEGLGDHTSAANWRLLGDQYREVFYRYFAD